MPRISRSTAPSDLPSSSSYAHLTDAERAIHHARPIVINGDPKEIATLRPSIPVNSAIVVRGRSETGKAKVEVGKGAVLNYVGGD